MHVLLDGFQGSLLRYSLWLRNLAPSALQRRFAHEFVFFSVVFRQPVVFHIDCPGQNKRDRHIIEPYAKFPGKFPGKFPRKPEY